MSMSDPIADMLTRIRNAQEVQKTKVVIPASKVKTGIARVLKDEGYISDFRDTEIDGKPGLEITDIRVVRANVFKAVQVFAGRPMLEGGREFDGRRDRPVQASSRNVDSFCLVVHVDVLVKEDCIEAFKEATLANAAASVEEPGIARFDVVQDRDVRRRGPRRRHQPCPGTG